MPHGAHVQMNRRRAVTVSSVSPVVVSGVQVFQCFVPTIPSVIFNGTELRNWIADYLYLRSQFVTFNRVHSYSAQITSGLPYHPALRPLLSIIYINDIIPAIQDTALKLRLCAYDCIQTSLILMMKWC